MGDEEQEHVGLENLSPPEGSKQDVKRVGRGPGSGVGKTSGRGHKGQKARSGGQVPTWFEGGQMPLYRRVPKRGFHPPNRIEVQIVNVGDLQELDADDLGPEELEGLGLIRSAEGRVKILGDGELERSVTVRAHAFSGSAREKIESAGGTAEVIG